MLRDPDAKGVETARDAAARHDDEQPRRTRQHLGRGGEANGMSREEALKSGVAKLLLWHLLQPALYLGYVFLDVLEELQPQQQALGGAVFVREMVYLLTVLACTWANPAFLLVDVGASVRGTSDAPGFAGHMFPSLYVLAPEKNRGLCAF